MRAIIIGTGPSLTPRAIDLINQSKLLKFGCNLAYRVVNLDVLYCNNKEFWAHYRDELAALGCAKWTYCEEVAQEHGARFIQGIWAPGLSTDPNVLHWGHGSGYELMGIAYHYGVTEFVLIGYDLRFPAGYDGIKQVTGGDRHFFGEYPPELQHWTKFNMGGNGELNGLLDCYRTIDTDALNIRIINCSPGSALDFFEMGTLAEYV